MSYTKKRVVEQIWLRVTGGNADVNVDVQQSDIYSYLPAAINASIGEDIKERKILAIRERRPSNVRMNDILIINSYIPTLDAARDAYKIELPFFIPSYGGSFPVNLMPEQGGNSFVFFDSRSKLQGIEGVMATTTYAWLERTITGQTLYFKNLLCPTCNIIVETACDFDSLDNDVPLPIPDDLMERVFERCVNYFTQQRFTPSDETVDGTDTIRQ